MLSKLYPFAFFVFFVCYTIRLTTDLLLKMIFYHKIVEEEQNEFMLKNITQS